MLKDLVIKNRSFRKFINKKKLDRNILIELIDMARTTPSSKNLQPLKYIIINKQEDCDFVFSQLKWAWYLKDWSGPSAEEQPPAYIIMCIDKTINEKALIDAGIASQTILLGASEKDIGGCIIRTVNGYAVSKHFYLPSNLEVVMVIALGYPDQIVIMTDIGDDGSIKYYEDNSGNHFVPKRSINDIIIDR